MGEKEKSGQLYYWIIAVLAFIIVFFSVGVAVTAYSATSYYVIEEWGITNTENSLLLTVRTLAAVVAMYLTSIYYKKLSIRVGLALGLLMGTAGYVVFALGSSMMYGYVAMTLIGFSHGFAGMIAISIIIERWFVKNRGTVLGIVTTASGFTTMIFPQILVRLVESVSLQFTFWMVAAMFGALAVISFLVIKNSPEDIGMVRLGEGQETQKSTKRSVTEKYAPNNFQLGLMLAACFLIGGMCYSQGQVRTLVFTSVGWSAESAATVLSVYGLTVILGKLIYGAVTDRVPMRKCTGVFFLFIAVSHALLGFAGASWFNMFWANAANVLYGIGGPVCTVGLALYGYEMCKDNDTTKWVRNYTVVYNIGALVFNPIVGVMADASGNYSSAFFMFAATAVIGAICTQAAYAGARRNSLTASGQK
ncbi:MAG: MFS transporter [Eubacterium sp.]|nr:MFS transporter [Eubacterium sp.]